jgi:hypothetical protein
MSHRYRIATELLSGLLLSLTTVLVVRGILVSIMPEPKKEVRTTSAPKALPGIYSQAIIANNTVYCSGSIGVDPVTNKLVEGDVSARTVHMPSSSPTLFHA